MSASEQAGLLNNPHARSIRLWRRRSVNDRPVRSLRRREKWLGEMPACLATSSATIVADVLPDVSQGIGHQQGRRVVLLVPDCAEDVLQGIAQPCRQLLVVIDPGQLGEGPEVHPKHLGLPGPGLDRGTRHHHHQFQQEALEQVAALLPPL